MLLLTLLLAMGRYTPLYRLFYGLPFFSRVRAPVKFVHLSELAVAVLFANGLAYFRLIGKGSAVIQGMPPHASPPEIPHSSRRLIHCILATCGTLSLLFVFLAIMLPNLSALHNYWGELGLLEFEKTIKTGMRSGLLRSALVSLACAAVFAVPLARKHILLSFGLSFLLIVMMADMATVARPYIRTGDVSPWYRPNPVAEIIKADPANGRASFHLGPLSWRNWAYGNMAHHGINFVQPPMQDIPLPEDYVKFFGALERDPIRLWTITNTRYIVGPSEHLASLKKHPQIESVIEFNILSGRYELTDPKGTFVLLRFDGALPRAKLYHQWEYAEDRQALQRLASPKWNYRESAIVSDPIDGQLPQGGSGVTQIILHRPNKVAIQCKSDSPALLVLNDRYDANWRVTINQRAAEIVRCNYIMRGVFVPAGENLVVFSYKPNLPWIALGLASLFFMLAWTVCCCIFSIHPLGSGILTQTIKES